MKRIAIACGDPSGVGPELIEHCLLNESFADAEFVVFGESDWAKRLESSELNRVEGVALGTARFRAGEPEPDGARTAIAAMEQAARSCLEGNCQAVVTGPISKGLCSKVGYAFPGQTEFFADRWGGEPTMAFAGEHLNVCLATWHIPLADVPAALTEESFGRAVRSAVDMGRRLGQPRPRVIVCGLNPHAGEGGILGMDERERLDPWLAELRGELDADLVGCVPGDTAFHRAMKGESDVVVALYHDQGLAPFKAVDFESGVNVTLGLRFLRVSPDHGTAFDIAGKGIASPGSVRRAIQLACKLG